MSSIKILLNNYPNVYYSGQPIVGEVHCNFRTDKYIKAIQISITGVAYTEWEEEKKLYNEESKKHESQKVKYYAEEKYFGAEQLLLQAGNYSYPFSYSLPSNIPSSYEGRFGRIRYCIYATAFRTNKSNYQDNICLNVASPYDLQITPGLFDPVSISMDKTTSSSCCSKSGRITLNLSLPSTGFVSGQEVKIDCHIGNSSKIDVECITFKIVGHIEFISHYPSRESKYEEFIIAECRESGVAARSEKFWNSCLIIPNNRYYPNLTICSIMNIIFRLKATVLLPEHGNLENEIPITLGVLPAPGINVITSESDSPSLLGFLPTPIIPPIVPNPNNEIINPVSPLNNNHMNPSAPEASSDILDDSKKMEMVRDPPSYDDDDHDDYDDY